MNVNDLVKQLLHGFLILMIQIIIFRTTALWGVASCFIYIGFLIQLPFYIPTIFLLLITFGYTLMIDIFYDSPGLHTAAALAIMYFRNGIFRMMTPSGGYDNKENTTIFSMGFQWHLLYAFLMVFVHTTLVFSIELLSIGTVWNCFLKIFSTSIFTVMMIMAYQMLFMYKRNFR